jgi:AcrR family transcriptional regulator
MSEKTADLEKRDRIMDAAKALILHYGYKKTTMQDIAKKADISVGSLYNFFQNKEDIAIECGKKFKAHLLDSLREVRDSELLPEEKLREMMFRSGLGCHEHFQDTPHGMEIVMALEHRKEELNEKFDAAELSIVAEVIEEGVQKGEFSVKDAKDTAKTFIAAFASFRPPTCMRFSEDEIKQEIIKMVDMLLPAIRRVK